MVLPNAKLCQWKKLINLSWWFWKLNFSFIQKCKSCQRIPIINTIILDIKICIKYISAELNKIINMLRIMKETNRRFYNFERMKKFNSWSHWLIFFSDTILHLVIINPPPDPVLVTFNASRARLVPFSWNNF